MTNINFHSLVNYIEEEGEMRLKAAISGCGSNFGSHLTRCNNVYVLCKS